MEYDDEIVEQAVCILWSADPGAALDAFYDTHEEDHYIDVWSAIRRLRAACERLLSVPDNRPCARTGST
jgi:hypothetical protein